MSGCYDEAGAYSQRRTDGLREYRPRGRLSSSFKMTVKLSREPWMFNRTREDCKEETTVGETWKMSCSW